jgi:surfactin synthase thioesterase subunit
MITKKKVLYFLHFAGGNKYSFQPILGHFKDFNVEVLELPGRGRRMGEKLLNSQENAVKDLYNQIKNRTSKNEFLIYGHSMGAVLGLKLCRMLQKDNILPKGLIVTGNPGPGIEKDIIRYNLPEDEFNAELKKLGGVPDEFFESKELYDFFAPVLRADFEVAEIDDGINTTPINIPIHAIMGQDENHVEDIYNWSKYTTSTFNSELWSGNHFFIFDHGEKLANKIKKIAMLN